MLQHAWPACRMYFRRQSANLWTRHSLPSFPLQSFQRLRKAKELLLDRYFESSIRLGLSCRIPLQKHLPCCLPCWQASCKDSLCPWLMLWLYPWSFRLGQGSSNSCPSGHVAMAKPSGPCSISEISLLLPVIRMAAGIERSV